MILVFFFFGFFLASRPSGDGRGHLDGFHDGQGFAGVGHHVPAAGGLSLRARQLQVHRLPGQPGLGRLLLQPRSQGSSCVSFSFLLLGSDVDRPGWVMPSQARPANVSLG